MSANAVSVSPFRGYRFPPEIITHAVWLYHRFSLSNRDVEELLAERGIHVSYEAIRLWCHKFGPLLASELRRRHPRRGDKWYWTKWLSRSTSLGTGCGVPSTRMEPSWTSWFRVDATSTPQSASGMPVDKASVGGRDRVGADIALLDPRQSSPCERWNV